MNLKIIIKINRIDVDSKNIENRGRYLSKYFGKDLDLKEHKKKAFFKSKPICREMGVTASKSESSTRNKSHADRRHFT